MLLDSMYSWAAYSQFVCENIIELLSIGSCRPMAYLVSPIVQTEVELKHGQLKGIFFKQLYKCSFLFPCSIWNSKSLCYNGFNWAHWRVFFIPNWTMGIVKPGQSWVTGAAVVNLLVVTCRSVLVSYAITMTT